MVSDFRKKKLVHVFTTFFDSNKSGTIDKKDFDLAAEKISQIRGWKAGDGAYSTLQDTLQKLWEGLQGADSDKDGEVSVDEWISAWDSYSKSPAEWQNLYAKFIFQLEDRSSDGSIDSEEFATVYSSFGVDKSEATTAFQKLSGGKASLTWDDFQVLFKEYFSSDDVNAPGNFIFGKTTF